MESTFWDELEQHSEVVVAAAVAPEAEAHPMETEDPFLGEDGEQGKRQHTSSLLPELTLAITETDPESPMLDDLLVDLCDYFTDVAHFFEPEVQRLKEELAVVHRDFRASGLAVARKRFALVMFLAPPMEWAPPPAHERVENVVPTPILDALEYAFERTLTPEEREAFKHLQTRWRDVLHDAGKRGVPKFAQLVFRCRGEMMLTLPMNSS